MPNCYIIDRATDTRVVAQYNLVSKRDLTTLSRNGWEFPWGSIGSHSEVRVFKVALGGVLQGLVAVVNEIEAESVLIRNIESAPHNKKNGQYILGPTLIAIAAKYSFDVGQDGYMRIKPKNRRLATFYASPDIGGVQVAPLLLHFYPQNSLMLMNKYLG